MAKDNHSIVFVMDDDQKSGRSRASVYRSTPVDFRPRTPYTGLDDDDNDEEEEVSEEESIVSIEDARETWGGRLDFLLSCIGFAVGLGNIWRFPYLCYSSGGGAFLIPYTMFLITCGLPLFFLEVSFGQFASLSPITIWRVCPLFKGIGFGMVIVSGIVCIYYNIIITWNFYFLFQSMQSELPWTHCDGYWNTESCVVTTVEGQMIGPGMEGNNTDLVFRGSSHEFWEHNVLDISSGIDELGDIRWPLFGNLLLAWTLVFLCLCKGVKSSGKVVYVTATFPYVVLCVLFIRGVTLPGALLGITFYLVPEWSKLASLKVWGDAAIQIFYSIGFAWGSLITMSSYNKFNNNVFKDAMLVPIINCATSVFAGFVIFSVLGFMSLKTGIPMAKVARSGPGLIFVVYPQAVALMPLPQLWAILFFMMVFTVGLDSQFGMFETMTSAFIDEFPHFLRRKKVIFTLFMCVLEFLLGLPMVFQGGMYILNLVDWYASVLSVMVMSMLECCILSWIYGVERFQKDIALMLGYEPHTIWKVMWKYVTPTIITFTLVSAMTQLQTVTYGSYEYPPTAVFFGWCLSFSSLIPIPVMAVLAILKERGTFRGRLKRAVRPTASWGPASVDDRIRYIASLTGSDRDRFDAAVEDLDVLNQNNLLSIALKEANTDRISQRLSFQRTFEVQESLGSGQQSQSDNNRL